LSLFHQQSQDNECVHHGNGINVTSVIEQTK